MIELQEKTHIESIAEDLVLVDPLDLPGMAMLVGRFDEIHADALAANEAALASLSKAASAALTAVILEETADTAASMAQVSELVMEMQRLATHGTSAPCQPGAAQQTAVDATAAQEFTGAPVEPAPVQVSPFALQDDPELLQEFIAESMEHLDKADQFLLALSSSPDDEDAVNTVFRAFHTIKGSAGFLQLNEILTTAHAAESMLDKVRKKEIEFCGGAMDAAFDAVDLLRRLVQEISNGSGAGDIARESAIPALIARLNAATLGTLPDSDLSHGEPKKLGVMLVESGAAHPDAIKNALCAQLDTELAGDPAKPLGQILVEQNQSSAKDVATALRRQAAPTIQSREAIRVDGERLDRLVNLVGELVIAEAMVSQAVAHQGLAMAEGAQLDKITRELQDIAMSLRMVPVRGTFQKMARLVHDLARKSGKETEFVTYGDETELDKNVVDLIGDPLMHMIRNSVDHGIEDTAEERIRAGKPAAGRVELRAFHKGGNIYIEIEDDGRGLDREKIIAKARERGLVHDGNELSDREVWNLIFLPGFSTAKTITDVSGRGVGMDVVKRNVAALRGRIDIQSKLGVGTTISIALPLTLAIIDGMVVRVGGERYILPMTSIVLSTRPSAGQLSHVAGRGDMVMLQNQLMPLYRLYKLLATPGAMEDPTNAIVVVVEEDGHRIGLLADELIGQQQTVIKSLGDALRGLPGIAGGAIMPDGRVGLILDVAGLVQIAGTAPAPNDGSAGTPP